ncbi:unnamed protein product, partial [Mesorhabditis belari]|uniref:3'-5' exonuclease domain-containing protein n=1 Tax=Mesorhabditis belari TaxID=2138241 RepID=A0AAF3J814_9BILA
MPLDPYDEDQVDMLYAEVKLMTNIPLHPNVLTLIGAVTRGGRYMPDAVLVEAGWMITVLANLDFYRFFERVPEDQLISREPLPYKPLDETTLTLVNDVEKLRSLKDTLNACQSFAVDLEILKVSHGADKDIVWLQRDFGIYVVNMFDTGRAARHLGLPKHSLQYLVEKNLMFQGF